MPVGTKTVTVTAARQLPPVLIIAVIVHVVKRMTGFVSKIIAMTIRPYTMISALRCTTWGCLPIATIKLLL